MLQRPGRKGEWLDGHGSAATTATIPAPDLPTTIPCCAELEQILQRKESIVTTNKLDVLQIRRELSSTLSTDAAILSKFEKFGEESRGGRYGIDSENRAEQGEFRSRGR